MATITGTDASDFLLGTADADLINGGLGNDTIRGLGGNDTLNGAEGNDSLDGGDGNDYLIGGAGNDTIQGGRGADTIEGTSGNNVLRGGKGHDSITGGTGNDTIYSGYGQDTLTGNGGTNVFVLKGKQDAANPSAVVAPTITDFVAGTDTIAIEGVTSDEITTALAGQTTVEGGVSFKIGDGTIVVKGTGLTSLTAANVVTEANIPVAPGSGETFNLTNGPDNIVGGSGNDLFSGVLTAGGAVTFQSFDKLDGGAGNNSLIAQGIGDVTTNADTLKNIQNITVVAGTAGNTLNLANTTGVEKVVLENSAGAYSVTNLDKGITQVSVVSNAANAQTFSFKTSAVSGADDAITLALSNAQNTINLNPVSGTNGFETVNIVATGGNSTVTIDDGASTSLKTLNVEASATTTTLTLAAGAAPTTVDASKSTGAVSVNLSNNTKDVTATGGSGNDTFIFGNTLTKADKIDGGAGTDTLQFNSAATTLTDTFDVKNVETLRVADALNANLDVSKFGDAVKTVRLDGDSNAARTISKLASGSVLELRAAQGAGTNHTLQLSSTTATDDSLTLNLRAALSAAGATTQDFQTVTAAGVENITISSGSSDTPDDKGDTNQIALTAANLETLTVTGTVGINLGTLGATVKTVDASGLVPTIAATSAAGTLEGGIQVTLGSAANQTTTVTAGNGNNIIVSGAGSDVITTGNGNDRVTMGAGNDKISLGAGNDQLVVAAAGDLTNNDTVDGGAGTDTIVVTAAQTISDSAFTNVSNFERLDIQVAGSVNLNLGSNAASAFNKTILISNTTNNATASNINGSSLASDVSLKAGMGSNAVNHTLIGGAGNDVLYGGNNNATGGNTLTGGAGNDIFAFATRAEANNGVAGGDTVFDGDRITDFSAGVDKFFLGTGANAFGGAITFTSSTVVNVAGTFTNAADRADLGALATAAQGALTGVASTAATVQAYIIVTGAEVTTATGLANKTFLVINDDTAAIAATDTWIDITGVTGTLSASDFQFGSVSGLFA